MAAIIEATFTCQHTQPYAVRSKQGVGGNQHELRDDWLEADVSRWYQAEVTKHFTITGMLQEDMYCKCVNNLPAL